MSARDHDEAGEQDAQLQAQIEALPRSREPRGDLWAGIATRIDVSRAARTRIRRRRLAAFGALAAAAAIAVTVTAVRVEKAYSPIASVFPPSSLSGLLPEPAPIVPSIVADRTPDTLLPEEESYRVAVRALEGPVADAQRTLSPKGAEALARDLKLMESAIEATRAALAKSPDDPDLRAALRDAYEDEIDALSDIIDLCAKT